MTTIDSMKQLQEHAEQIQNDELRTFEDSAWSVGAVSAQGDLYIVCIGELPASAKKRKNKQMAEGDTQGSRHLLTKGRAFDCDSAEVIAAIKQATKVSVAAAYIGPVFTGPAYLQHPEHGDQQWVGECINAVVFQRSLDAEEREQRVRD